MAKSLSNIGAGRGSTVLYCDQENGYLPAVVTNRPTDEYPMVDLVVLVSGMSACAFSKRGISYGLRPGQWCWPGEEPDPPVQAAKPRPPHELEDERATAFAVAIKAAEETK